MELINRATLKELLAPQESPCVSIYLPLHRGQSNEHENARHLKAALSDVEQRLATLGLSPKGRVQFLASARAFASDQLTLPHDAEGMALFLAPGMSRAEMLPFPPQDTIIVADHFHVAPLLPLLQRNTQFYILAVSKNRCRFIVVTGERAVEAAVPGMPLSLEDAWRGMERLETNIQFHSAGSPGGSKVAAFHGGGGAKDEGERELDLYLQRVAKSLEQGLHGQSSPLVFAGVKELFGVFRKHNAYAHLMEEAILGNPDDLSPQELGEKAFPLVSSRIDAAGEAALRTYEEQGGTGKTSTDVRVVVSAAVAGRVGHLLLAEGAVVWGLIDPLSGDIHVHEEQGLRDDELLGHAAVHTLLHDGEVIVLPQEKMPDHAVIAAVMRY